MTCCVLLAQQQPIRPLSELINTQDPGWPLVQVWIKAATNQLEVLPKDSTRADSTLYHTQVTTRSTMGAIIYESGGILIDHGWIRLLGSGSIKLPRTIFSWNKGKSILNEGQAPTYLLIADDALGGFFAINNGSLSDGDIGKVFYFAPDNLQWESLSMSYTDFVLFCFSGDLNKFYEGFRWKDWQKDVATISGDQGFLFLPYLFTKEGKDINKVSKKAVPIEELWGMYQQIAAGK